MPKTIKAQNEKKIKSRLNKLKYFSTALLTTVATWLPLSSAKSNPSDFGERNPMQTELSNSLDIDSLSETADLLTLASPNDERGFSTRILEISVKTEASPHYKNPAATATGNGYYGQHQFGSTSSSDYAVKKYLAYAMVNSSVEFRNAIAQNLMTGTQAQKDKLIDNFEVSTQKYADRNQIEKAYYSANKAYAALANSIQVTPAAFTKAMNAAPKESQDTQGMFIYEIYIYQMNNGFDVIQKKHPRIDFSKIHPAVLGSAIAIAVKIGNGKKFNAALSVLEADLEKADKEALLSVQKKIDAAWEKSIQEDLKKGKITAQEAEVLSNYKSEAIVDRSGKLDEKNVRLSGNRITIYDPSGRLDQSMILTAPNHQVSIVREAAPKLDDTQMYKPVQIVDRSKAKPNYALINNKTWLKNYCGNKFIPVYREAAPLLDKMPTMATIYELSIILRRPQLYEMYQTVKQRPINEKQVAQNADNSRLIQEKLLLLREAKHLSLLKENLSLLSAKELTALAEDSKNRANISAFHMARRIKGDVRNA